MDKNKRNWVVFIVAQFDLIERIVTVSYEARARRREDLPGSH